MTPPAFPRPPEERLIRSLPPRWRTAGWTALAMLAFAANSWLCRGGLRSGAIDPAAFTSIRLFAGAAVLIATSRFARAFRREALVGASPSAGSWPAAIALFAYAAAFSFAYLRLEAGTGALVLFGAVQLTMLAGGLCSGVRPHAAELVGITVALAGLAILAAPGRGAPDPVALVLMALAGVCWGSYSLIGRSAARPLAATTGNFLRATLPALALAALALPGATPLAPLSPPRPDGVALALLSGGVTSGLGYVFWYAALPGLAAAQAGLVQLSVPVLAALGGVLLLDERLTLRLASAGLLVLAGLALALRTPPGRRDSSRG